MFGVQFPIQTESFRSLGSSRSLKSQLSVHIVSLGWLRLLSAAYIASSEPLEWIGSEVLQRQQPSVNQVLRKKGCIPTQPIYFIFNTRKKSSASRKGMVWHLQHGDSCCLLVDLLC